MRVVERHTIAVAAPHDGTDGDGHGQARGHAPCEETGHGASKTPEDDGFAAEFVGCPPPGHGCEALRDGEDGSRKTSPSCDVDLGDAKAGYHLGEIGKDRGQGQRLSEPGNSCGKGAEC